MAFESLSAFLWMEGHGPYVWWCYGVFAVSLGALMAWSFRRHRITLQRLRTRIERTDQGTSPVRPSASFTPVQPSERE